MKNSNFIWSDLSTFDLDATQNFYTKVFGWDFMSEEEYSFGYVGREQAAGVYVMPEKFQQMNLPSFWMSYISVTNIENVVALAQEMGGIIEVKPTDFLGQGQIALIRDPSGAGFTIWEGPDLGGKEADGPHGRMAWNELIVSDASLVLDFYRTVFGWSFTLEQSTNEERYEIRNGAGEVIAALQVIPNEIKGKEEFWVPYFAVKNLSQTLSLVQQEGGETVEQSQSAAGNLALVRDPQGAAFALLENPHASVSSEKQGGSSMVNRGAAGSTSGAVGGFLSRFKLRTFLALLIVYTAVLFNLTWVWGLLFLVGVIPDLRSGHTNLMEPISRAENPIWYWAIVGTWLWMSVYLLMTVFG